jgi:hypothetical protein
MKNIIIVLFSIILGIYLYGQVLGDDEGTLKNASQGVMEQQIEDYKNIP